MTPFADKSIALLIVDDEQNMVTELSEAFSDNGYVVHAANSALLALELLSEHQDIGVMITDIRMPVCDGIELTKRACTERSERQALEVIFITGHGTITEAAAFLPNTNFKLLRKPFHLNEILDVTGQASVRSASRRHAA